MFDKVHGKTPELVRTLATACINSANTKELVLLSQISILERFMQGGRNTSTQNSLPRKLLIFSKLI